MASTRSNSRANSASRNAVLAMLEDDHKRVKKAFKNFEKLDPHEDREECESLVRHTCAELQVHAALEEELFYPAVREAVAEHDLLDEAEVEHATAKQLIGQLESMSPDDEKYAAHFTVLGEYVQHHVKEEEKEMFPKLQRTKIDWQSLQEEMEARREELMTEFMPEEEAGETMPPPSARSRQAGRGRSAGTRARG